MYVIRVLTATVVCGCTAILAAPGSKDDKPRAESVAHFRFDGNAKNEGKGEAEFEFKNTEFKDKSLYLNGLYEHNPLEKGFRAVCKTPKLDYEKFSVALRFKAQEFGEGRSTLFMGGTSYRWFGLGRSAGGKLVVTFNNMDFIKEIEGATLEKGKWTVVACSVDVPGRKVIVTLNGKKAGVIDLPKDFELRIVKSEAKDRDKNWTFTNYAGGWPAFHGLVDELLIYGRPLSAEELEMIPLRP